MPSGARGSWMGKIRGVRGGESNFLLGTDRLSAKTSRNGAEHHQVPARIQAGLRGLPVTSSSVW